MKSQPTESQIRASDLRATPFGHLLVELLEAELTGTLLVYDPADSLHAAIFIESGRPQKALADHEGEHNLGTVLLPLCGWASGRFEFMEGQDLVGTDSPVRGTVDPVALVAAAARGPLREDVLEQAMSLIVRSYIKRGHRLEPRRYGFTAQEQRVVAAIGAGPIGYDELRNQIADVPERVVQRVLYVLRLTRGIGLISIQRMVSGTLARPNSQAPESYRPASRSTHSRPIASEPSQPPRAASGPAPRAPGRPDPTASGQQPITRPSEPNGRTTLPEASRAPEAPSMPAPSRTPSTPSMPAAYSARPGAPIAPPFPSQAAPAPSQRPTRTQPPFRSQRPRAGSIPETSSAPPMARSSQSSGAHPVSGTESLRAKRPSDPRMNAPSLPASPASSVPPRDQRREDPEALWRKAEAMGKRNEFDAALQTAKQAMKLGGTRPEHDALLGWLMFAHGQGDPEVMPHVWRCLDRALKRESMCEQALYYKALVLNATDEPDQARAHLQRVLMLNPDHTDAAHELRIMEMRRTHEQQQSGFLRRLLTGKGK